MPLQSLPKYSHLIVVVHQCGVKLTKELFLKKVQDFTPEGHDPYPWTVDHFLDKNRDSILSHELGKKSKKYLFPGVSKSTDIGRWDLNTFCFLLIHFCNLDGPVKQDIKHLRQLRNKLVHSGLEKDIDDRSYEDKLNILEGIINRCANFIGKAELEEELKYCIKETGKIQLADVEERKTKLVKWLENEKKYNVWLDISHEGLENIRVFLQDILDKYESNGKRAKIPISMTVAIKFIEIYRELENAHAALQEGRKIETNEADIRLHIEQIKDDVREMGPEVESDSSGSILFKFTCFSVTSLIYLVDYFSGPILEKRVQAIAKANNDITEDMMKIQIFVPDDNRLEIMHKLEEDSKSLTEAAYQRRKVKVFNDPLYGQIDLHPLCVKVIDTPQFQRLRYIKQLDTCYFVYPGASHNRFEHSIGVCHLAGKLLRVLKDRQPELDITTKDILCVEIAALCHDLGQGPFSHVFEHKFLPATNGNSIWKHERLAVEMFDYMLRDKGGKLDKLLRSEIPGFEDRDIQFIKEIIDVPKELDSETWPFIGRDKNKSFLYEVVANHVNGIDVDRWDYIARDSYMLGMKAVFDHNRCIQHARVIQTDGRKQICYREKAAQDLYDMFYSRMALYRRAYQHKTHNIIGLMVRDALLAANDKIIFIGENGDRLSISDTIKDMKAFTHLTDDILQQILRSTEEDLETSRAIINRIVDREFYKCITQTQVDVKKNGWILKTEVQENLFNMINQKLEEPKDLSEIIEIDVVNLDYGSKEKDPITNVWFFKKEQEDKAIRISKEQVSFVLPDTFAEQYIRVYCSVTDQQLFDIIEKSFSEWCKENDVPQPKGNENISPGCLVSDS